MNDPFSNLNFGKSMGRIFFQKHIFAKFSKKSPTFIKIGANFLIFGKCMGPIMGQNLVNVWVSFHFPRGTSPINKNLEYPPLPPPGTIHIETVRVLQLM